MKVVDSLDTWLKDIGTDIHDDEQALVAWIKRLFHHQKAGDTIMPPPQAGTATVDRSTMIGAGTAATPVVGPANGGPNGPLVTNADAKAVQFDGLVPDTDGAVRLPEITREGRENARFLLDPVKSLFPPNSREYAIIDLNCNREEADDTTFDVHRVPQGADFTLDGDKPFSNTYAIPKRVQTKADAVSFVNTQSDVKPQANQESTMSANKSNLGPLPADFPKDRLTWTESKWQQEIADAKAKLDAWNAEKEAAGEYGGKGQPGKVGDPHYVWSGLVANHKMVQERGLIPTS